MMASIKRILSNAWKDFSRNLGLSLATTFIITMVVLLITFLFLGNWAATIFIHSVQEKIDISIYFKKDVASEDIFSVKDEIAKLPQVKGVEYISKEQALDAFMAKHQNDQTIIDSLREIGENPFLASLSVKAWQSSQYEQVADLLEQASYKNFIEKVDYYERKPVVDKIFATISWVNAAGLILSIILALVAALVAFNTIRLAIYNASEEIKIMRLVGASNSFVRGPFLAQGIIVGGLAFLITFILTFIICFVLDSKVKGVVSEISTLHLWFSNIGWLILIQFLAGIGLVMISSLIAIRKYLKI